jgi:PAS domain S-box-containing protein
MNTSSTESDFQGHSPAPRDFDDPGSAKRTFFGPVIFGILLSALVLEAAARYIKAGLPEYALLSGLISDAAIVTLLSPGVYLILRIHDTPRVKYMVVLGTLFLVLSHWLQLTADLGSLREWPILGDEGGGNRTARWALLVLGLVLMLASLYFALLETVLTKADLLRDRNLLLREIEERRKAEEALVDQENIYREAIAQAGAIPYRINWQNKQYTFYDDRVYRLTGYTPEELTFAKIRSLSVETHFLGPLSGMSATMVSRLIAAQVLRNLYIEHKIITKSGQVRWVSDSRVEIAGDDGKIVETVGLFQDVTERKCELEALARNERYFRALTENALDLITVLNADGTVRYVSPSVLKVLGYAPEDLIGGGIVRLIHPVDRKRVMTILAESIEQPESSHRVQCRCLHQDGSWRTLESIGRSMLNDPNIGGAVINSRDVSERVQLEEQLLQSQKMESIGCLAGGVAHDFNNLLTCITGYCEMALGRVNKDEKLANQLQLIREASYRASDLTRQLLAFARKQIIEPRNTNLNALTLNLDKMLRRLIGEDIELVTFPSEDPAIVRIDPGQFEQVAINLAINARDAMPQGGKLTIEIKHMAIDREYAKFHPDMRPGEYVMLAISDTGVGMTEAVRARIFEPFFTTKEAGKGTGLGLATCYGIVRQAGGYVWVYSEPDKGTTFKIYLPKAEGASQSVKARTVPARLERGTETILLVEDEPLVRGITHEVLTEHGYTIIEAQDGMSALALAEKHHEAIDLLLTDVVLPQVSGRDLAEQVRTKCPQVRVLFMSGYTEDAIVHHGVLERGIEFLPKPFTPEGLVRKVQSVLEVPAGIPEPICETPQPVS